jgi:hypothetical protein
MNTVLVYKFFETYRKRDMSRTERVFSLEMVFLAVWGPVRCARSSHIGSQTLIP